MGNRDHKKPRSQEEDFPRALSRPDSTHPQHVPRKWSRDTFFTIGPKSYSRSIEYLFMPLHSDALSNAIIFYYPQTYCEIYQFECHIHAISKYLNASRIRIKNSIFRTLSWLQTG